MKTDREKLYGSLKDGMVTIKVPFNPLLLAVLGQYNPLKEEDRPELGEVANLKMFLARTFNINLY